MKLRICKNPIFVEKNQFISKNDHFGVFWGYHHLRKHPYIYIYMYICIYMFLYIWPNYSHLTRPQPKEEKSLHFREILDRYVHTATFLFYILIFPAASSGSVWWATLWDMSSSDSFFDCEIWTRRNQCFWYAIHFLWWQRCLWCDLFLHSFCFFFWVGDKNHFGDFRWISKIWKLPVYILLSY